MGGKKAVAGVSCVAPRGVLIRHSYLVLKQAAIDNRPRAKKFRQQEEKFLAPSILNAKAARSRPYVGNGHVNVFALSDIFKP
jgi:hypothetical protein